MTRRYVLLTALTVAALAVAGCSGSEPTSGSASSPTAPAPVVSEGTLVPAAQGGPALTYAPAAAPAGAKLQVQTVRAATSTTATLTVAGLLPNRGYAAHLHAKPCGPTGNDAGPHFQNQVDPAATPQKPSSDPAYANPRNEFWLDVHTDGAGAGTSSTTVPFALTNRAPTSLIVHEKETTSSAAEQAGTAGGRLACLNVTP